MEQKISLNTVLTIIAAAILIMSGSLFAYNIMGKNSEAGESLLINGNEYLWIELFTENNKITLIADDGDEYTGIPLDDLLVDAGIEENGVGCEDLSYTIVGADGYQKTVSWHDIENGVLIENEKTVFFKTLPKAFWVKNIIEIEASQ